MINNKLESDIVEGAIEILEARGWCQGRSRMSDGRVCVGEALVEVATQTRLEYGADPNWRDRVSRADYGAFKTLQFLITKGEIWEDALPIHGKGVPQWNDATDQTYEHVRDRLIAVSKQLREEGR